MLIFSGPAQAVSVMILGLQDKYTQGSSVKFQVEIDINDVDRFVQITNVSLDVAGPIDKSSTFLLDGTRIEGDENITIEPFSTPGIADYGYGPGFGYDFGYGYGYGNLGFGYGYGYGRSYDFGYGYGYGYGYGENGYGGGGGKLTYIYNVTVNTTYFPIGSYEVVAHLNTGNNVKTSFDSAPATFRLIIPATVRIKPKTLNLASNGVFTAFIKLPAGYNVSDIDNRTVMSEGAPIDHWNIANDEFIAHFRTEDLKVISPGLNVKFTVTGNLFDGTPFEGSDMIDVISQGQSTTDSSSSSSGSSTGGGGVSTPEPFENIIKYETRDCFLTAGKPASCKFTVPEHWISELVITGKESETASFRIEALKGLSPNVNVPAPGTKYFNVWPGSKRIQEALLRFTVDNSWLKSEGLTARRWATSRN